MKIQSKAMQVVLFIGFCALLAGGQYLANRFNIPLPWNSGPAPAPSPSPGPAPPPTRPNTHSGPTAVKPPAPSSKTGERVILDAFRDRRSGIRVETTGVAIKLLPDDREGSAHQRFIFRLSGGHTVLVAHNIDLAPRVPLSRGDSVTIRGQYEWNDRGGVLHWTHHDPRGRHPGGWIVHDKRKYQ